MYPVLLVPEQQAQTGMTGMSGRMNSRIDYTADLDIPPFLRRNREYIRDLV